MDDRKSGNSMPSVLLDDDDIYIYAYAHKVHYVRQVWAEFYSELFTVKGLINGIYGD